MSKNTFQEVEEPPQWIQGSLVARTTSWTTHIRSNQGRRHTLHSAQIKRGPSRSSSVYVLSVWKTKSLSAAASPIYNTGGTAFPYHGTAQHLETRK